MEYHWVNAHTHTYIYIMGINGMNTVDTMEYHWYHECYRKYHQDSSTPVERPLRALSIKHGEGSQFPGCPSHC